MGKGDLEAGIEQLHAAQRQRAIDAGKSAEDFDRESKELAQRIIQGTEQETGKKFSDRDVQPE